jgi:hypothetical protein
MTTFQETLAQRIYTNPAFQQDYNHLLYFDLARQFGPVEKPSSLRVQRLAESAVIMASSPQEIHRRHAFELSALLLENLSDDLQGLPGVFKLICARVGNIPSVNLISEEKTTLPKMLNVEAELSIDKNTVFINGQNVRLSDIQVQVLEMLNQGLSLSLSSPTSSGKSFLLTHFVAQQFTNHKKYQALILVPTRALIRQFTLDIANILRNNNTNDVEMVTSSMDKSTTTDTTTKRLFILTQERLQAILYNWKQKPTFDILVVDESQNIGDGSRGIILEDIIGDLLVSQGRLQTIFLSPLSSNPGFMFETLGMEVSRTSLRTSLSPVSQKVYSVNTSPSNPQVLTVSRLLDGQEMPIIEVTTRNAVP